MQQLVRRWFRGGGLSSWLHWNHTQQSKKPPLVFVIWAPIQQCHGVEEPQKYPRMSSKCPSLCVHKHTVLTTGFAYASQRKKSVGGYMLHVLSCLSHHLRCLVIYLFTLKPTCIPSHAWQVFISQESCPHFTYRELSSAWGYSWFPLQSTGAAHVHPGGSVPQPPGATSAGEQKINIL